MTAPNVLDLIERACSTDARVHVIPAGRTVTVEELWRAAARSAAWTQAEVGGSAPIAVVLDTSVESVSAFLGAMRSGRRVISLPNPPRGRGALVRYQRFIEQACAATGATHLMVRDDLLPLLPPMRVATCGFAASVTSSVPGNVRLDRHGQAELVQFTSGSSGDPKGVALPVDRLSSNVYAIIEALEPQPGDGSCSWLPLSHDMGLIGMLLTALAAAGPDHARGGDIALIAPEWFLRRPQSWLETCSELGSTITAAPDFGFRRAVEAERTKSVSLRRLRTCITGAEPVRAATLREFGRSFEGSGFRPESFCPAYGLAEASLAVTMSRPDAPPQVLAVDADALVGGEVVESDGGRELVSAGEPLNGFEVAVEATEGAVGRVRLRGPSLLTGYVPGPSTSPVDPDGWFSTQDLGFLRGGQLYLVGRIDDVVLVGGRNLNLGDVDDHVAEDLHVNRSRVQAFPYGDGFGLVAELDGSTAATGVRALRAAAVRAVGVAPQFAAVVAPGSLPRTPSGKPRRGELAALVSSGELGSEAEKHTVLVERRAEGGSDGVG